MYRRRTRSPLKRLSIPLGPLRLDVGPHDAPDGTLSTCKNLRPAGPREQPYYTPVVLAQLLTKALGTVVAIGKQVLDDTTKLIVVTTQRIILVNPETPSTFKTVYTFDAASPTRKAQFAEIGRRCYIATSTGTFPEKPEHLLVLDGTTCRRVYTPMLPQIHAATATATPGAGLVPAANYGSVYGYRWAYQFRDGSIGPASRPLFFYLKDGGLGADQGWVITFEIYEYPDSDNPTTPGSYWENEITGIVIYMSTGVTGTGTATIDGMVNAPYYRAMTWSRPSEHSVPGSQIKWQGSESDLIAGESLPDDNLWQHAIEASAAFGYNEQLILGDAQYDFRKPNAMQTFVGVSSERDADDDLAVRLGVTIRTATGEYQRISDPVYVANGEPSEEVTVRGTYSFVASSWIYGMLAYPDSRVVQFQIYVDHDNDDGYELLSTHEASRAGNLAYALVNTVDLTGPRSTAMPAIATAHATRDRDPNRVLRSSAFQPLHIPAANAFYSATSDADSVIAFQANTLPISEGQYGAAPLIVFGRRTIRAIETDSSGNLVRAVPLAQKGIVSRYAVTNGEGILYFASDDGIWTLTPHLASDPISRPVHSFEAEDADILDELDSSVALAYIDDARGNRDLWVGTSSRMWCLSAIYGRWFTMDRKRGVLFRCDKSLYGFDAATSFLTEEVQHPNDGKGFPSAVAFEAVTRPMTMTLEPGQIRRIYRIGIRQRVGLDYLQYEMYSPVPSGDLVEPNIEISGSYTIGSSERLVAVDSLSVDTGETLTVDGNLFVVSASEGALVAAGTLSADKTDIQGHDAGLCRDVVAKISGRGKMGQGLEAFEFDVEPRLPHRPRRRQY